MCTCMCSLKCPQFLSYFHQTLILLTDFSKRTPASRNNRLVGAEFYHVGWQTDGRTDGRTDMAKLTVAVRQYANASEVAVNIYLLFLLFF
jgi:hypothetical protein